MKKFYKYKFFWPFLTLIFTIPSLSFFLKPGNLYWNMHDDMQMIRQLEFEKCLKDGQIPCRWTPDLGYGYGYPLFNYYPPLPYIIGQIYRTVGLTFTQSVKATAFTQIILSMVFMYILANSIFGPIGGFISSVFFTYVPYHALNIFVRGAMNEAWASTFFPLIFYYSRLLVLNKKNKDLIGLSISFACLLLSHNPMVLTFTPILFLWILFWIFSKYKKPLNLFLKKQIPLFIKLIFSGLFASFLTAFFTLPVLSESKFVQITSMFQNYFEYSIHFTSLKQLFFSNYWSDGPSTWGPYDQMSFMVGYLHWIIPVLMLIFILFFKSKNKIIKKINYLYLLLLLLIFMGFFSIFMTHNKSTFIWQLFPVIQKIQFPWRFLNHSAFLLSLASGGIILILDKILPKLKIIFSIVLTFLVLIFNVSYFTPVTYGPLNEINKFSGDSWINQVTGGIYDYLPITAKTAAKSAAKSIIDEINPNLALNNISGEKHGTDWLFFDISLNQDAFVTIAQLAFPNFEIYQNNKKINYHIDPELGRMVIKLSSGEHQIFIKLKNTPIRTISNYISLFSWILLILYLSKPLWKRLIYKK